MIVHRSAPPRPTRLRPPAVEKTGIDPDAFASVAVPIADHGQRALSVTPPDGRVDRASWSPAASSTSPRPRPMPPTSSPAPVSTGSTP